MSAAATSTVNDGVLAYDDQAERCVLGAMLLSPRAVVEVRELLRPEDFYRPQHEATYAAILSLASAGTAVDHVTVAAELERRGDLARVGGPVFLLDLSRAVPTAANAPYWAELVNEAADRRRLVAAGQRLVQLASDTSRDPAELVAAARETLGRIRGAADEQYAYARRMVPGGTFTHDAPAHVPALWGTGDDVLWAEGEPLLLTGPTGVGKTTLGGQLVAGRLGLHDEVLGYPVRPGRRVLYLAMDRPAQIARALRRLLARYPREHLDERLVVWSGPPPRDLARHPALLLQLAQDADADTVVIDSLKDAAVKLADEETGQGLSRAMNHCVAEGVEVLAYHHQTKRGGDGKGKPNGLADVYGSAWITAGAGSVLLLWGAAGDPVVELSHLKQPAAEVGPLQIIHDHEHGTSRVGDAVDVLELLRFRPRTIADVAQAMFGEDYTPAQKEKARRKVAGLVEGGMAVQVSGETRGGVRGGADGARYGARVVHEPTHTACAAEHDAPGA